MYTKRDIIKAIKSWFTFKDTGGVIGGDITANRVSAKNSTSGKSARLGVDTLGNISLQRLDASGNFTSNMMEDINGKIRFDKSIIAGVYNQSLNGNNASTNGFVEQWGFFTTNNMVANQVYEFTITLPLLYENVFIGVSSSVVYCTDSGGYIIKENIYAPNSITQTKSTFLLQVKSPVNITGNCKIFWQAKGY